MHRVWGGPNARPTFLRAVFEERQHSRALVAENEIVAPHMVPIRGNHGTRTAIELTA